MQDLECKTLCLKSSTKQGNKDFEWMIENDYHFTLYVDNLPSAFMNREEKPVIQYSSGVPVGYIGVNGEKYLYNHLEMVIEYNPTLDNTNASRINGFRIEPKS